MSSYELAMTLGSALFFMLLVAWISYRQTRGTATTQAGYFLAGRGLSAVFIAGSLLLTNLSAEQLIGLNGSAYGYNMSSMGWEVTAALATICMAFVFLPRYLAGAFTTLPEFLNQRFDGDVRRLSVLLFLLGYGLVTIPSVLYSGSIAVLQLFDLPLLLDVSYGTALAVTIVAIGLIGALYAVFGGLRAVAVSDTLNGVGLLVIGVAVPWLGLSALGNGSLEQGLARLLSEHTEKLNAIGAATDPTPFGTLFTGMIFANLFYWCTNQYVIQRTLGAKNLAEGQKGVLLSGYFKVLVPFMMMLPGVIAFHLYGGSQSVGGLASIDLAYPRLIRDLLPGYAMGFFLAVLLGAVFSSFNSLLNSAATLFCIDIYLPYKAARGAPALDDGQVVTLARRASVVIALFSFIVAPMLQYAPEGLWQVIRVFTGFYNIPMIAIVLVGLFTRRVPAFAAKWVIVFHIVAYGLLQFVFKQQVPVHFLHLYAILFCLEVAMMLFAGYRWPVHGKAHFEPLEKVDMRPWKFAIPCAATLMSCVVGLYLTLSPIGLVDGISASYTPLMATLIAVNIIFWWRFLRAPAGVGESV